MKEGVVAPFFAGYIGWYAFSPNPFIDAIVKAFKGYWWRWARRQAQREQADRDDAAWVALYGQEAFDRALASTDWVLQLQYPPPPDPRSGGALAANDQLLDQPLVVQAAWGGPRLWPAHMVAGMSAVQVAQLRLMHSTTAAVSAARWAP